MKKSVVIISLAIAVALAAVGITGIVLAFKATQGRSAGYFDDRAGAHFTSYEASGYPDLTYAAENAVQAVVNIEVTLEVNVGGGFNPFYEFFGMPQGESMQERKAGGSGVIISSDGYIVTNHHVVDGAKSMKVKLYDGRTFDAVLVGTDPSTEVALVKIEAGDLPTLAFGSSDNLRLGEWVLAIGSPFDLQSTITAGIVSAKGRHLGAIDERYRLESFIQTDAAVNPGNSGGALVNTAGELVGINTLIKSPTGTYMGYSFAIPSSIVQRVVSDIREYGVAQRPMLGVSNTDVSPEFLERYGEQYNITELGGAAVMAVEPGSAAEEAGIKVGDVITAVDGTQVDARNNLGEIIASRYKPNDKVKISVKRGGKVKQFDVVLRNRAGKAELLSSDYVAAAESLGGRFAEINDRTRKELEIDNGIRVVEVTEGGILARARVRQGFVITHINEKPVRSVGDLDRIGERITYIEGIYPNGRRMAFSIVE